MSRKVFVTSDMSSDEKLIDVAEDSPQTALLWPWFLLHFDDWGRAEASAKRIKAEVFPMNPAVDIEDVGNAITLFEKHRLILLYNVGDKRYMAIPPDKWFKYQTHIRKEKRDIDQSKYPPPPLDVSARERAQLREDARESAQLRADANPRARSTPSPSPTPSLSPTPSGESNPSSERDAKDSETDGVGVGVVFEELERLLGKRNVEAVRDRVLAELQELSADGQDGAAFVVAAILEAQRQNKSTWAYVQGIINNCRQEGRLPGEKKARLEGSASPRGQPEQQVVEIDGQRYLKGKHGPLIPFT